MNSYDTDAASQTHSPVNAQTQSHILRMATAFLAASMLLTSCGEKPANSSPPAPSVKNPVEEATPAPIETSGKDTPESPPARKVTLKALAESFQAGKKAGYDGVIEEAKVAKTTMKVGTIDAMVNMFRFKNAGRLPASLQTLVEVGMVKDTSTLNDEWGNPITFERKRTRSGAAFDIYSSGPDGKPGTEDDIGNWSKP